MKLLKNISYLLFIVLFSSSCDSDDDSFSGSLVGQWNWVSTTTTVTDDDGSVSEQTSVPTEDNNWTLTFNDNNTFTQIICCYDDDDGYNDDYEQNGGTWFAESGMLTMSADGDDTSFELDYVLSNESNTLTMTQYIDAFNEDEDGNWSNSAVVVINLNRSE